MDMTVTVRRRATPLVVSVLLAQRRLASVDSSAMTTQPSAREQASALSTSSRGPVELTDGLAVIRPASSLVLSIRTRRNRALGQPWLTAATCPGWPLPQLNAPPSR